MVFAVWTAKVDVPEGAAVLSETLTGVRLAVAPAGRPDTVNDVDPVRPPTLVTVTVVALLCPCWIDWLAELTAIVKSGFTVEDAA